MTYALSAALQAAVFQQLYTDPEVVRHLGSHIYDALPFGTAPQLYAQLGPETVKDASDATGHGAQHDFTVSVVTTQAGFTAAKEAAAAICTALENPLTLTAGHLISLAFTRAVATRQGDETRRIDLRFRARTQLN